MNDIVERLRVMSNAVAISAPLNGGGIQLMAEAADEIERLRAGSVSWTIQGRFQGPSAGWATWVTNVDDPVEALAHYRGVMPENEFRAVRHTATVSDL